MHAPRASAALFACLFLLPTTASAAAAPPSTDPCSAAAQDPQCVAALGPLSDVSHRWRDYQPALVQVVPMSDYASSDPEAQPPPAGAGPCGGETQNQGPGQGQVMQEPPPGIPAPPGSHGPYCVLHYLARDFTPLCGGCHRVLIDYSRIPAGDDTSPGSQGHWAGKFSQGAPVRLRTFSNGHSPNIKNLCADKFVNPGPGATCPAYARLDGSAVEYEGDTSRYHHFVTEGRFYNGPAYLAGDGRRVPYHYVTGAYLDVEASGPTTLWYGAGYRGRGDALPDTDQSYGCLCELPPFGHQAYSPEYALAERDR